MKKDQQPKLHIVQNASPVLYSPHPVILHNIRERERNRKRASSSTASPEEAFSDKRAHTSKLDASTGRPEPNADNGYSEDAPITWQILTRALPGKPGIVTVQTLPPASIIYLAFLAAMP